MNASVYDTATCLYSPPGWSARPVSRGDNFPDTGGSRAWQPRLGYGGTYDAQWTERRAPLWPRDFDERFFQAASPGLIATPWLEGGESVVLSGLSPDGTFSFRLPRHRFVASAVFRNRVERRRMRLDGVLLEPDERLLRLYWRAAFPAEREFAHHEQTLVRELEPWEDG
nr:DUF2169 domain-containing protein [Myxococcus xanthus]